MFMCPYGKGALQINGIVILAGDHVFMRELKTPAGKLALVIGQVSRIAHIFLVGILRAVIIDRLDIVVTEPG